MIWLTKSVADFDAEKRRRRYAFVMGAVGGATLVGSVLLNIWISGDYLSAQNEPLWEILIVIFGVWLFFFMLKYAAAYALWYKAYNSRKRAVFLSLFAVFTVYFLVIGVSSVFTVNQNPLINQNLTKSVEIFFKAFGTLHKNIYGIPYLFAAIIGWRFARTAPDARDSF